MTRKPILPDLLEGQTAAHEEVVSTTGRRVAARYDIDHPIFVTSVLER